MKVSERIKRVYGECSWCVASASTSCNITLLTSPYSMNPFDSIRNTCRKSTLKQGSDLLNE